MKTPPYMHILREWYMMDVMGGQVAFGSPRVRTINDKEVRPSGQFVLYWMTSTRRYHYNAALERAIDISISLNKPLLVIECISVRHEWSSERVLTFVAQGMVDNMSTFDDHGITYIPWIENHIDSGDGMLRKLSSKACSIVIDDYPTYLPRWVMDRASLSSEGFCGSRRLQRNTPHELRGQSTQDSLFIQETCPEEPSRCSLHISKRGPDGRNKV